MRLIEGWSNGTSYGIPTGPVASGLIAEALLHEVDEFLDSQNIDFVRFVDDYIIFTSDEASSQRALFVLGQRLHNTQGLSLNMAKTRVYKAVDFLKMWSRAGHPDSAMRELVLEKVFNGNSYADVEYTELSQEQKELIDALDVRSLLEDALAGTHVIDLGAVRFVLNVLSAFHRPELIDPVLANLDRLAPVSAAVARFLDVFDDVDHVERAKIARHLIKFWTAEKFVSDYQFMWLLEPFAKSARWNHLSEMRSLAREGKHRMIRRQAILALGQIGDRSSLLDVKARLSESKDWEHRAIIYACRKLPKDERSAFYASLKPGSEWKLDNLLVKATIKLAEADA